ncbi:acyl-coenzyme A diphosphatase NUDT19-like isoform X2 [Dysidea avara]
MEDTLVKKPPAERLPLYSGIPGDSIIGELAFRICAIREAFEETGILLARPIESISQALLGTQAPCYRLLKNIGEEWRKRVCDDASNFVQLFREIRCIPDVWSLIEWSNWLTPENLTRRYDTMFYLCCLEGKPPPMFNPSEVSKAEWLSVEETLELNTQQQLTLPPPQLTELSNIKLLPTIHHLHLYGLYQNMFASRVCLLPRRLLVDFTNQAGSMLYSLLPGDDLYPVETSPNTYQCANEALKLTLQRSDHPLYEFTSTVKDNSHLVTHKMRRMMLEQMIIASYVDTVRTDDLISIISDINDCIVPNSKL